MISEVIKVISEGIKVMSEIVFEGPYRKCPSEPWNGTPPLIQQLHQCAAMFLLSEETIRIAEGGCITKSFIACLLRHV
jgi:hypothetical protein